MASINTGGHVRASIVSAALFLVFIAAATAQAASPLTATLQNRYAAIATMQADFTQTLVHKESGSRKKAAGVLSFKKPLLVRWEISSPAREILLVGKNAIWNAFFDEEIVYKYSLNLAQDSRSIIRVVTGQARLDQDFIVQEEGREGKLAKLRLFPKEPSQAMVEALLWVDTSTDLIKKVRVYDFFGNENEVSFGKITLGPSLPEAFFSYTPPKGFIVEDMTGKSGAQPKNPLMQ